MSLSHFYKSGLYHLSNCKPCHRIITDKWKEEHRDKAREWSARYRENNPEKARAINKVSKEKRKLLYGVADKRRKAEYDKIYLAKNRDRVVERGRQYYLLNKDKYRIYTKEKRAREELDPMKKLHRCISLQVYNSLKSKKGGSPVFKLLGYSLTELKIHLEKQFVPGMSWENRGLYGWHIDHKTPVVYFHYSSPEDPSFKQCWALSNLQPLWAIDNIKKGARLQQYSPQTN